MTSSSASVPGLTMEYSAYSMITGDYGDYGIPTSPPNRTETTSFFNDHSPVAVSHQSPRDRRPHTTSSIGTGSRFFPSDDCSVTSYRSLSTRPRAQTTSLPSSSSSSNCRPPLTPTAKRHVSPLRRIQRHSSYSGSIASVPAYTNTTATTTTMTPNSPSMVVAPKSPTKKTKFASRLTPIDPTKVRVMLKPMTTPVRQRPSPKVRAPPTTPNKPTMMMKASSNHYCKEALTVTGGSKNNNNNHVDSIENSFANKNNNNYNNITNKAPQNVTHPLSTPLSATSESSSTFCFSCQLYKHEAELLQQENEQLKQSVSDLFKLLSENQQMQ